MRNTKTSMAAVHAENDMSNEVADITMLTRP